MVVIFLFVPWAYVSGADPVWTQTTKLDFDGGTLNQVETFDPGDVKLAQVGWGSYSSELLVNPGAETGDTTGWTAEGSNTGNFTAGFDCPSGSAGPHSGSYCFYWNRPSASDDWAYQEVDLSAYLGKIQAGEAQIRAEGWLVCSEYHVPVWDIARLKVVLYDSGHAEISTIYDTGELNIQNWTEYLVEDYDLPTNTEYVRLYFQTYEPNWDAGNADDLTFKIRVTEYYPSGTLESSAYDCGYKTNFNDISFTINEPTGTDVKFQIRTAATEANLATATWYGPTGTGDYYQTSGDSINPIHNGDRWVQYKAFFSTTDVSATPTLSDISISYTPQEPTADFSADPTSGEVPLTVQLTDESTGGDINSWSWDFGDGDISDEQNPSHTYTTGGLYTVNLTVSGPGGTYTETKEDYIRVYEAPAPVTKKAPKTARLSVRNLRVMPAEVYPNDWVTIDFDVKNSGGRRGSKVVEVLINGYREYSERVSVYPGSSEHVRCFVYKTIPGQYIVTVEEATGWFNVLHLPESGQPSYTVVESDNGAGLSTGGIIAIVVIGIMVIVGIIVAIMMTHRV